MEIVRPTRGSRVGITVAAVLGSVAVALVLSGGNGPAAGVTAVAVVVLAVTVSVWAVLRARRQQREFERRLTSWAGQRAAQGERLRIAREGHDLVSHGLGLITVRAASARAAAPGDALESLAALTDIEEVSRETTRELRRMLTLLRGPEGEGGEESVPLRPVESMTDLPAIVQSARDAGLDVRLAPGGTGGDVSPGVQLAVCAVVREALHNCLRHAGPTTAEVSVTGSGDGLVVTVRDRGPVPGWQPAAGAGYGLVGLRERVTALGGSLHAGRTDRGFVVSARLPERPGEVRR
ncbi:sensor histidine kinase [Uniformispora flossi]|uniref:sensor histidine kinase n=1 Tax=Uniformispora flossi TaxID=3390723 RepID=UPI003C2F0097